MGFAISVDGSQVVFASAATSVLARLQDFNPSYEVFLFDRVSSVTVLVSREFDSEPVAACGGYPDAVSDDSNLVVFGSSCPVLVQGVVDADQTAYEPRRWYPAPWARQRRQ